MNFIVRFLYVLMALWRTINKNDFQNLFGDRDVGDFIDSNSDIDFEGFEREEIGEEGSDSEELSDDNEDEKPLPWSDKLKGIEVDAFEM